MGLYWDQHPRLVFSMLVHHRLLHAYGHACVHVCVHAYAHACAHGDVLPYVHDYAHDHVLHHNPSHHIFWYHDDRDDHDVYGRDRLCISIVIIITKDDVD
jgi:hypothetical protein